MRTEVTLITTPDRCPHCGDPDVEWIVKMRRYSGTTAWFRCTRCGVFCRDTETERRVEHPRTP